MLWGRWARGRSLRPISVSIMPWRIHATSRSSGQTGRIVSRVLPGFSYNMLLQRLIIPITTHLTPVLPPTRAFFTFFHLLPSPSQTPLVCSTMETSTTAPARPRPSCAAAPLDRRIHWASAPLPRPTLCRAQRAGCQAGAAPRAHSARTRITWRPQGECFA